MKKTASLRWVTWCRSREARNYSGSTRRRLRGVDKRATRRSTQPEQTTILILAAPLDRSTPMSGRPNGRVTLPMEKILANPHRNLSSTATTDAAAAQRDPLRKGWFRWIICGLLFFAVTVSYIDRQVIGVLKATLMQTYRWSEGDFANIIFVFQLAYVLGQLLSGRLFDRIGVRLGFVIVVLMWSVAAMAHGLVGLVPTDAAWSVPVGLGTTKILHIGLISVLGFSLARFALGLPEGGTFPGAVKAVSEWFPRRERCWLPGFSTAAPTSARRSRRWLYRS